MLFIVFKSDRKLTAQCPKGAENSWLLLNKANSFKAKTGKLAGDCIMVGNFALYCITPDYVTP